MTSSARFRHRTRQMSMYRMVMARLQNVYDWRAPCPGAVRAAAAAGPRRHDSEAECRGMAKIALALSSSIMTQKAPGKLSSPGKLGYNRTLGRFGCGPRSVGRRVRRVTLHASVPRHEACAVHPQDVPVGVRPVAARLPVPRAAGRARGHQPASPSRPHRARHRARPVRLRTSFLPTHWTQRFS